MSIAVQHKRDSSALSKTYIGKPGEFTVNTDNWEVYVHDGVTPGGHALAHAVSLGLRNLIINGDFGTWQRGASFAAIAAGLYSVDRFEVYRASFALGATLSRQPSSGIVRSEYVARLQRDSGNTDTDALCLSSALESSNSRHLAGQSVTLSVKLRKGANYSGGDVSFKIVNGTGTDQGLGGTNFTGHNELAIGAASLTTSFQTFPVTGAVPSNSTQLGIILSYTPTGTAGADDWIEIAEVQLEKGSVATNFEHRDKGLELRMCQRYFNSSFGTNVVPANGASPSVGIGGTVRSDGAFITNTLIFGTEMRTVPTMNLYYPSGGASGNALGHINGGAAANATLLIDSTQTSKLGFGLYMMGQTIGAVGFYQFNYTSNSEL